MSTSLALQLKKLAVPQTSLLLQDKKKTSLLFDPREAAKFDREAFYEIGVSGLEELIKLNPRFTEFQNNLFDLSARSLERSVENEKGNKKLNKLIQKFLLLLSPYFLIKSSHKALEWLVNRFHIEAYNVDDLIALILPYHSTLIFVRVLQMIDVSDPTNKWHWLHPLKGAGVPLSKRALLNHCATDPSFLKFVCQTTSAAVKAHKSKRNALSTLLAFHCTTIIGGLEYSSQVDELQLTHIMESILEGLSSLVLDYSAGSFMIAAQIVRRAKLNEKIVHGILKKVVKCPHDSLNAEKALLMVVLYQTQNTSEISPMPVKTLKRILLLHWLPVALGQLRSSGVHLNSFFLSLLRDLLLIIQSTIDERKVFCKFVNLLVENALDDASVHLAMKVIIETFKVDSLTSGMKSDSAEKEENEEDETDKEEEDETTHNVLAIHDAEEVVKWYSEFFQSLERKYPVAYDKVIHQYLDKVKTSSKHWKTVRILLGISRDGKSGSSLERIELFERLHHSNTTLRVAAVNHLVKNYSSLTEHNADLISSAVTTRLKDDSAEVVKETLGFPTEVLVEALGAESVVEEFMTLSIQCLNNNDKKDWSSVAVLLVKHLCSDQLQAESEFSKTCVLMTLLPFLFPTSAINVPAMKEILQHQIFMKKHKLLTALSEELNSKGSSFSGLNSCSALVNCLSGGEKLSDVEALLEYLEKVASKRGKALHIFLLFLMFGASVPPKMDPAKGQKILDLFVLCIRDFQVVYVPGKLMENSGKVMLQAMCVSSSGCIPLSGYMYCVLQLTQHSQLPSALKSEKCMWWDMHFSDNHDDHSALKFAVRTLEVLITGCGAKAKTVRICYADCLKEFFKVHFSNLEIQLRFLCNVCAYSGSNSDGIAWLELRIRCLHLLITLLNIQDCPVSWALNLKESIVPALLISAMSPLAPIRHMALNCLLQLCSSFGANLNEDTYTPLINRIKERLEEIKLDAEQLPLVMYTTLSPDPAVQSFSQPSEKHQLPAILNTLFSLITSEGIPVYIKMGLLDMLGSVNSEELFLKLATLGLSVASSDKDDDGYLDNYRSAILCNIIQRLTRETATCLEKPKCWNFILSAMLDWKTKVVLSTGSSTWLTVLIMQQLTREMFEVLSETIQQKLLTLLVKAASDCEIPEVGSTAGKVVKKIILDCKLAAAELEKMRNAEVAQEQLLSSSTKTRAKRRMNQPPSPALLQTEAWRHGVTLLEWMQSKKKLQSAHLLLSPLFSVLDKCLAFEEQGPVEYTKQLVLSCLLQCCKKLSPDGTPVEKSVMQVFNVEAIVQCIRASQNPQTHHHALLLLAHIAGMMPEQVLHNIMAIFTFMGSSILRQDDAYSFQVISKIVDTIIPILVKASEGVFKHTSEVDSAISAVLRVFADTVLDVPEHRRQLIYKKLLNTLGPDNSLWLLLCLVFEGHVLHGHEEQTQDSHRERGEMPHRQEFALNLTRSFAPSTVIKTCTKLVKYIQSLPVDKGQSGRAGRVQKTSGLALALVPGLFNVESHTAKQLRHYKFSLCTFMSSLLSSPQFVKQVAELSDHAIEELEPLYQELIENLLTHIKSVSQQHLQITASKTEQGAKYWNAMLNLAYDILDKVNALLPSTMFLLVIRALFNHKLLAVRRKAMELLNTRLQLQTSIFAACDRKAFYALLEPLLLIMESIGKEKTEPEVETNQQVAMISVKLITRQLAPEDPTYFVQILKRVTELAKSELVQKNLLASVVLCLAELVISLKAHAIGHLNQFMPAVINILHGQSDLESPNLVLLSVVTAAQKIVESLPYFLSPYLDKLLLEISILSTKWQHLSDDNKVIPVQNKLKAIRQKISSTIPARVLTPAVGRCYSSLLKRKQYAALGPLFSILTDCFSLLASSEFTQLMPDLTFFFLLALQFRSDSEDSLSQEEIAEIENHIVNALVALVLKLSESSFRPLYQTLFHWATSTEAHQDRAITFYRLSSSIAEALKGLFVLFAGRIIQNAAKLLDCVSLSIEQQEDDKEPVYDDEKAQLLLQYILQTLHNVFLHESGQGFITKERFDALMLPMVNQLENTLGGVEALKSRSSSLLSPCLSQFAVAVADDTLWKQLNYQILLKTRHKTPQVRLAALEVLCEMARKLGDDFLPLLPENVPFLAELLEDEEEEVETACQKAVQELEEIVGEPLKKYF